MEKCTIVEVYHASDSLFNAIISIAVIYAVGFAAFEEKLGCGKRKKFHIACIISFLAAAPLSYAVAVLCGEYLADYYRSVKDYDGFMSGLAKSLEGIQFGIYMYMQFAGFAAGYVLLGLKSLVKKVIEKISG